MFPAGRLAEKPTGHGSAEGMIVRLRDSLAVRKSTEMG